MSSNKGLTGGQNYNLSRSNKNPDPLDIKNVGLYGWNKQKLDLMLKQANETEEVDIGPLAINTVDETKQVLEEIDNQISKINSSITSLETELKDIDDEIKRLQEQYDSRALNVEAVTVAGQEDKEFIALREKIDGLKNDKKIINQTISELKESKKTYEKNKKIAPYLFLQADSEYQEYNIKSISDEEWIKMLESAKKKQSDGSELVYYADLKEKYGDNCPTPYEFLKFYNKINYEEEGKRINDKTCPVMMIDEDLDYDTFTLMIELNDINPEYGKTYDYLYETKGKEEADKYLKLMKDSINNEVGQKRANEFLSNLDESDDIMSELSNHLKVTGKGLDDGVDSYLAGLKEWIQGNDTNTIDEYESMYIMMALADEESKKNAGLITEEGTSASGIIDYTKDYGVLLDKNYKYSQAIGDMLPSMALSVLDPMIGTISLGTSSGGQMYHQALVEGYDRKASLVYGLVTGLSSATLERVLGAIPGLGKLSEETGGILKKMLSEGGEEALEQLLQEGVWDQLILGKAVSIDELSSDMLDSFIDGAIISGLLNGANSTVNFTYQGIEYALSYENIQAISTKIKEGMPSKEAFIEVLNASLADNRGMVDFGYIFGKNNGDVIKGFDVNKEMINVQNIISTIEIKNPGRGIEILQNYLQTGNSNYITKSNNCRAYIEYLPNEVIAECLNRINITNYASNINYNSMNKMNYNQIQTLAQKWGVSTQEAQYALNNKAKELVANSDFGIFVKSENLSSILSSGSFKNQFETGTSGGVYDLQGRADFENRNFSIPYNTNNSDRPIYGMLTPKADLNNIDFTNYLRNPYNRANYGNCVCIMKKDSIINNTTLTFGDSYSYNLVPTSASDPQFFGSFSQMFNGINTIGDLNNATLTQLTNNGVTNTYPEIQIHGKAAHSVSNIEKIVFYGSEPDSKLKKQLKKLNIQWEVVY